MIIAASKLGLFISKPFLRIESLGDNCGFKARALDLKAFLRIERLGEKWYQ